ncbi:MAG TPA: RcnB family protein [Allosphingosinicella sp.]|jgi:hypothetical protein
MRKAFYVVLMAATVGSGISPAFAQNREGRGGQRTEQRQERREFRGIFRAARQEQRAERQAEARPQRVEQAQPAPQRAERREQRQAERAERRQPDVAVQPVDTSVREQRQAQREVYRRQGAGGPLQGDRAGREQNRAERQAVFEQQLREQPARTFGRAERREDRVERREDRRDYRQDRREDRVERRDDRRDYRQDRRAERRWDRNWRQDNRYDWQRYRYANRNLYRSGRYYSPYRNHSYSRISIGFSLGSLFYSDRYWLSDPWQYRLPPAYPGTRWVRYYDDVLLVDTYTGEVIDVIYDFFW